MMTNVVEQLKGLMILVEVAWNIQIFVSLFLEMLVLEVKINVAALQIIVQPRLTSALQRERLIAAPRSTINVMTVVLTATTNSNSQY